MSTLDQRDAARRLLPLLRRDFSYFSAKVRPALRYKRIPYVEIAGHAATRTATSSCRAPAWRSFRSS